jgi:hypothetical protein
VSGSSGASTPTRAWTSASATLPRLVPRLGRLRRTTFTRQAAKLWAVKGQLGQQLLSQVGLDPQVSILDSFPMPVCRFGRADRCRRLAGLAAFGRDEGAKQTYDGVRAQLRGCWPGGSPTATWPRPTS